MAAILRILFRRGTPCRLRLMAIANVFACAFVIVMTLLTTALSYYVIVPSIFGDSERSVTVHRCAIGYLFINVCGNYLLCLCVDTSTACAKTLTSRQRRNVASRPTAAKANATQACDRKLDSSDTSSKANDANTALQDSLPAPAASSARSHSPPRRKSKSSSNSSKSDLTSSTPGAQSCNGDSVIKRVKTNEASSDRDNSYSAKVGPNRESLAAAASGRSQSTYVLKSSSSSAPNSSSAVAPRSSSPSTDEPLRSHDCKLCEKRILRRDHHCFFMTVCVGYHNHKHFIFFCLYMMIGAFYGVVITAK